MYFETLIRVIHCYEIGNEDYEDMRGGDSETLRREDDDVRGDGEDGCCPSAPPVPPVRLGNGRVVLVVGVVVSNAGEPDSTSQEGAGDKFAFVLS